jgi:O-antigen/teichoic acid export membrane protein
MKEKARKPVFYLVIRFVTLGLRFLFFALFFKYSEEVYGEYSLVATNVMFGVYMLGLEFYSYANREMLKPQASYGQIFKHQLLFYAGAYVIMLPLIYGFFYAGFLNKAYWWWFLPVLLVEHLSYEVYRLLFVLKKPLEANINLFFRNGFWLAGALVYMFLYGGIDIPVLLKFWLVGDLLSLTVFIPVARAYGLFTFTGISTDKTWIRKGLKVAFPFFLATLGFKIIEFSDRYFIDWYLGKKELGIYAFFGNISYLVNTVVYTVVISLLFPGIMESILSGDKVLFADRFEEFKRKISRWTWLSAAGVSLLLPVLLWILHKDEHLSLYYVFLILVAANVWLNFSLIYHFVLYGYRKDWKIFRAVAAGMAVNVGLNFIAVPVWGITGAAFTTLLAMGIIFVVKFVEARKYLLYNS